MRPIAFEFMEIPTLKNLDFSLIEYSERLNLSVNKKTGQPAIEVLSLDTATMTRAQMESTDSDKNAINAVIETSTIAKFDGEGSSDMDETGISMLIDTTTQTFTSTEQSDNDADRRSMLALMDTTTLTESREDTDQDK